MKSVSIFISETLRLERLWCFPGTISSWRSFPSYKRLREKLAWENNFQFIFQKYFNIWNMFVSMRSLSMYMYIKFMNINYYIESSLEFVSLCTCKCCAFCTSHIQVLEMGEVCFPNSKGRIHQWICTLPLGGF